MRLLVAVALLALLGTALAGCSTKDPLRYPSPVTSSTSHSATGSASASASATATGTSSGTATSTGLAGNGTGANHAPLPSLVATADGLAVAFNLTASDADNDTLSWSLAFGDGNQTTGAALPAAVNHTYAAAGNYTARLTVSDGQDNGTANATVALQAGGGATQVADLTWMAPNAACGASYPAWTFGTPADGVAWKELDVDPATVGKPYTATFTYTAVGPLGTVAMDFYDGGTPPMQVSGGFFETGTTSVAGTVPAGAVHAVFFDCFTSGGTEVHYAA